jgi:YD repeat-containing protein
MKFNLLFLSILALLLHACSKDNDTKPSGGTGKLSKVVSTDDSYTTTVLYSYDANGKLLGKRATWRQNQAVGGGSGEDGFRIVRKAGEMIDKIVFKSSYNADSTTCTTTSSGPLYTSMEWTDLFASHAVTRKFSFTYDNQGKIASVTETDIYGGQPDPKNRYNFTYQNNNLTSIKTYRLSTGTDIFFDDYSLEYDQKVNPIAFGNESILLSFVSGRSFVQCSANNLTKMTVKQVGSPSPDVVTTVSYTYNDQNMPVKATANSSRAASPEISSFTYE